jgi:hypothetical protein
MSKTFLHENRIFCLQLDPDYVPLSPHPQLKVVTELRPFKYKRYPVHKCYFRGFRYDFMDSSRPPINYELCVTVS